MVVDALDRAEAVVNQVENFARAQQASQPQPRPAVVSVRQGIG
jgi:hypothetical protein